MFMMLPVVRVYDIMNKTVKFYDKLQYVFCCFISKLVIDLYFFIYLYLKCVFDSC
jgi:hypothetical protein